MIKEAIGAVMTAAIAALCLWLIIPMLNTAKVSVWETVDDSNETNAQLLSLGDMVFMGLIFMVLLVAGFTILMYATRRDPFQQGAFA